MKIPTSNVLNANPKEEIMRRNKTLFYHISVFVIAQLAWLALLGIWIYWYVSNYLVITRVGNQVSEQVVYDVTNVAPFVGGIILLVGVSFLMSLIFRHLNVQLRITKLYDNFIANITHELKSPLASIQLYLETLKQRNVPVKKQDEFYDLMMKDTERLFYLINTILDISSFDPKKTKQRFRIHKIDELVREIIADSAEQFRLPDNSVIIEVNSSGIILADSDGLKTVFNNLIDNSIKYSSGDPEIKIKMYKDEKKYIIEFEDNGIGIPAGERKKIFNKFYRIVNSSSPSVKGTGLGLFWVREIIKSHKGKIFVKEKANGTIFRIELPLYRNGGEESEEVFLTNKTDKPEPVND